MGSQQVVSLAVLADEDPGVLNGMRLTALTLFEEKFGPLDASIRGRVKKASRDQILIWMKKILTASSVDEVLAT